MTHGVPRPRPWRAVRAGRSSWVRVMAGAAVILLTWQPHGQPDASSGAAVGDAAGPTTSGRGAAQAGNITAVHRDGQTFVTWQEAEPAPPDRVTAGEFPTLLERDRERQIRYRIYRSTQPISNFEDATLVGETGLLSAWNPGFDGQNPSPDREVPRYVIEDEGSPLSSGTGLFVFNPPEAGTAYYAVARSERGVEDSRVVGNVTGAVSETVGRGTPVLQRVEEPDQFQFIEGSTLHYYVRWETSPNSAMEGKPFDYLVAVPRGVRYPAPVGIHLHGWGGSMTRDYGWWFNAERGAILVASNQEPYDWWTGYHEQLWSGTLGTQEAWQAGVVRPYTERRLFSFVDWLATERELDLSRLFTAGNSMGGSGALMLAIRNPQRVAWSISWVGVHVPLDSPTFRASYELVFGDPAWNVRFEDGTPVWDHYDDAWYLRQHPDQDVGFLTFSNGKNDDSIGWAQAVDFIRALQDTRQPHLFVWGQQGHGQRAVMPGGGDGEHRVMPIDLTTDQSLPAFSRSTLDDDPGDGSPDSGAPVGQINRFLTWDPDSIVDEAGRWSIEISVIDNGPASEASVDVTPRRLQQFQVTPGDVFAWTNTRGRQVVQQGEVIADEWGLVTVPQVRVTRGGNRLSINRR